MEKRRPQVQRLASYVLLVDGAKILLCRLSRFTGEPGRWTLPGGGVEFGEHPRDAAIREVREETGLGIRLGEVEAIDAEVFHNADCDLHAVRIIFRGEALPGELTPETNNSTDLCAWVTTEEARSMPLVPVARLGLRLAFRSAER